MFAYFSSVAVRPCLADPIGVSHLLAYRCKKTSFVTTLAFVINTLVAQIVLTLR